MIQVIFNTMDMARKTNENNESLVQKRITYHNSNDRYDKTVSKNTTNPLLTSITLLLVYRNILAMRHPYIPYVRQFSRKIPVCENKYLSLKLFFNIYHVLPPFIQRIIPPIQHKNAARLISGILLRIIFNSHLTDLEIFLKNKKSPHRHFMR
ncbi:MAG: hypothetical protein E7672_00160 [Ruminococcaceae bacterium]|nr:hypothetical protein [Oscillospiraceae bacterium]